MKPAVGDLVRGKYRVQRLIGDGGMGSVYEALHEALNTEVALKFLHTELARRPGLAARFAREARVAAAIQSPHVTRVNDVDTTEDGTPFIVLELLRGQSLATVLSKEPFGRLSPDECIDFTLQILAGLEAAHARGVVHRDLKPDNVFVTPSPGGPVIKLFDFGIAKIRESKEFSQGLTHAGILMGTPEYMAPEQLYSASGVDHRADLYSLGVMLFEVLSGRLPAEGESAASIVAQVQQGTSTRLEELMPDLPPNLLDVVRIALAPDPRQRFDSAFAMRQALARFAGDLSEAGQLAATRTSITTPPKLTGAASPPGQSHGSLLASVSGAAPGAGEAPVPDGLPDTVPPQLVDPPTGTEPPAGHAPQRPSTVLTPAVPAAFDALRAGSRGFATANTPPAVRPKKKGALPWILGSVAALLGCAIGIVAYQQHRVDDFKPPPLATSTLDAPPPTATQPDTAKSPSAATTDPPPAAPNTPVTHKPTTPGHPPVTPPRPPASGTGGTPQTPGTNEPQTPPAPFGFPLPLPSTFPPLPSTLPPLPDSITSALPTSFPPIFQPPAQPPAKDAEGDQQ